MAPRTGERKLQILQTLASMLEHPRGERVTTAALAARLSVSEAALYRHFASKAQMFEGLIEFIEHTLFGLVNRIAADESDGARQLHQTIAMLLSFAEKNPGMVRVLIGDALVNEDERLQARINQLIDRLEAAIKQSLRIAATATPALHWAEDGQPGAAARGGTDLASQEAKPGLAARPPETQDAAARANLIMCYVLGRWHQYAKSGFKRVPSEMWDRQWPILL
jgi:TetR/AcrR family transcriptional regulator